MKKIFFVILVILVFVGNVKAESPYKINLVTDLSVLAGGVGLLGVGFYSENNIEPYSAVDISELQNNVNRVDNIATKQWSVPLQDASNYLLYTSFVLPGSLMFSDKIRSASKDILILYLESYLYSISLNKIVKGIVKRDRPYLYNDNPDISIELKEEIDARRSFYSGHTNLAFTASMLTAKIYSDFYPNSKYSGLIWGGAMLFGSAMGYCRVGGGMHYPTDVIAGAVIGGVIGYLVPEIHKTATLSTVSNGNGIILSFSF